MDLEDRINIVKDLIARRDEIDRQLADLFGGTVPEKAPRVCKTCGEAGYNARSCPQSLKTKETEHGKAS